MEATDDERPYTIGGCITYSISGFECNVLSIANCEVSHNSQSKKIAKSEHVPCNSQSMRVQCHLQLIDLKPDIQ